MSDRVIPDDPLAFIQQCIRAGYIQWTYHVNMRLKGRFIPRTMILGSVDRYQIIESYPDDKYLPSYLVYARYHDTVIHILFAVDVPENHVRIVTAYYPNPAEWDDELKVRRLSL